MKELGLAAHRVAQVLVELVEDVGVGRVLADVPQLEPLAGEILHECAPRSRVFGADVAPAAAGRRARLSRFRLASSSELVVRDAAPQEERQPRRELEIADPIYRARLGARRIVLDAEQEFWIDQQPLERPLQTRLEITLGVAAARVVERRQPVDIGVG